MACRVLAKWILLFLISLSVSACASYFKKKECEKANWYQLGQKIAHEGKRPDADSYVQECRKVEANINEAHLDRGFKQGMDDYCRPETVLQTGRNGQPFNTDFCSPEKLSKLKGIHKRGIDEYCTPAGGYRVGTEGKVYTGVCTAQQEGVFMPDYKRGRKKYLENRITDTERRLSENDRATRQKQTEIQSTSFRLAALPAPKRVKERKYDEFSKKYVEKESLIDPYENEREGLNSEVSRSRQELNQLVTERKQLSAELSDYQKELVKVTE